MVLSQMILEIKTIWKFYNSCIYFMLVLQSVATDLEDRVTILEENGGSDGNSSVAELEMRLEALEGTAAGHETRITDAEADIDGRASCNLLKVVIKCTVLDNPKQK